MADGTQPALLKCLNGKIVYIPQGLSFQSTNSIEGERVRVFLYLATEITDTNLNTHNRQTIRAKRQQRLPFEIYEGYRNRLVVDKIQLSRLRWCGHLIGISENDLDPKVLQYSWLNGVAIKF